MKIIITIEGNKEDLEKAKMSFNDLKKNALNDSDVEFNRSSEKSFFAKDIIRNLTLTVEEAWTFLKKSDEISS